MGWGGVLVPGLSTDTGGIQDDVSVFQRATRLLPISLLSPGRVKTRRKSPESRAARNSLHFDSVVTVIFV